MIYKFYAPLAIKLAKKVDGKSYRLNLNQYRNWQHNVSNSLKVKYKELVSAQFEGVVIQPPVTIKFVLYNDSNRRIDRANVCCIHEKFFCDALVEAGCLPDDNDKFILETVYRSGKVSPKAGRVEIIITEVSGIEE